MGKFKDICMIQKIRKNIYLLIAFLLAIDGILTKAYFVDVDIGSRFKNFGNELLTSDVIFLTALLLFVIGLILYLIQLNRNSTLTDSSIVISAFLVLPIIIVLGAIPILMTFYPNEPDDSFITNIILTITIIGTFSFFVWVINILIILLSQSFLILKANFKK